MTLSYCCVLFTTPIDGRRPSPEMLARGSYDDVRHVFDNRRLAETEAVVFYQEQPATDAPLTPLKQIAARYARGFMF